MNELKQWIPLFFYHQERMYGIFISDHLEWFVRRFFNLILAFPLQALAIIVFVLIATQIPEAFWEATTGKIIGYTIGLLLALLAPIRITRNHSYLIYRKIFKEGLYSS